ncbi:MAG: hypothetical protein ABIL66_08870 [candidate division WOR-3 bacterium]
MILIMVMFVAALLLTIAGFFKFCAYISQGLGIYYAFEQNANIGNPHPTPELLQHIRAANTSWSSLLTIFLFHFLRFLLHLFAGLLLWAISLLAVFINYLLIKNAIGHLFSSDIIITWNRLELSQVDIISLLIAIVESLAVFIFFMLKSKIKEYSRKPLEMTVDYNVNEFVPVRMVARETIANNPGVEVHQPFLGEPQTHIHNLWFFQYLLRFFLILTPTLLITDYLLNINKNYLIFVEEGSASGHSAFLLAAMISLLTVIAPVVAGISGNIAFKQVEVLSRVTGSAFTEMTRIINIGLLGQKFKKEIEKKKKGGNDVNYKIH